MHQNTHTQKIKTDFKNTKKLRLNKITIEYCDSLLGLYRDFSCRLFQISFVPNPWKELNPCILFKNKTNNKGTAQTRQEPFAQRTDLPAAQRRAQQPQVCTSVRALSGTVPLAQLKGSVPVPLTLKPLQAQHFSKHGHMMASVSAEVAASPSQSACQNVL